ncbi:hypothetical protein IP70_02080 [alpha proteobacterium AAP38]|uniref:Uncharacterized protein n=1 Tax=Niveispirillum cyanobacteriorum TaxID=1612173 RepID=A0A2K9N7U6_9PROT|nr:hypothetical protein [Niveispirillum cyanobacteriorum]AUN29149.1 hypothetical protein C0V82_01960 [Niveispirillum cyanobacteriorum]KPF87654.1 hypothetical protein IP70_02080 [alpha proteobacterium AAP38]GGE67050.1 hypothetical protein GCM10011317_25430 [Niveispirillum cyanobacteriorum]
MHVLALSPWRLLPLAPLLVLLSACASPCQRIDNELRQLNADTIRDPAMASDGRYLSRFQELAAQSVEKGCLGGR